MDASCVIIASMERRNQLVAAVVACGLLWLAWPGVSQAQQGPEDTVSAHFAAISAEDYTGADGYFSAAFLRAFKADVDKLNYYYLARRAQLAAGYEITETARLNDPGRETLLVVVEFGPINPDAFVTATERMHYYLVREKVEAGAPLRDGQGMAWRIDIFDALRFDTLADARRRPYLYTRESWDDDATRELRSRQGLYRIYLALEAFKADQGQYPLRILGGTNRRDELISGGYIQDSYPGCGFDDRPMEEYGADRNHAGDFGYYSLDRDGDGVREGFWLILHGKDQAGFYFTDRDIIYIINQDYAPDQRELAEQFAQFWEAHRGEPLIMRSIPWELGLEQETQGVASAAADALHRLEEAPAPAGQLRPVFPGIIAPRESTGAPAPPAPGEQAQGEAASEPPAEGDATDSLDAIRGTLQASSAAMAVAEQLHAWAELLRAPDTSEQPAPELLLPVPDGPLEVHSYGL